MSVIAMLHQPCILNPQEPFPPHWCHNSWASSGKGRMLRMLTTSVVAAALTALLSCSSKPDFSPNPAYHSTRFPETRSMNGQSCGCTGAKLNESLSSEPQDDDVPIRFLLKELASHKTQDEIHT